MNDAIFFCVSHVSLVGIIRSIVFEDGADPVKNVQIERIQGIHESVVFSENDICPWKRKHFRRHDL